LSYSRNQLIQNDLEHARQAAYSALSLCVQPHIPAGHAKPLEAPPGAVLHKVAQTVHRIESSGNYYALFKRSGKQIRKAPESANGHQTPRPRRRAPNADAPGFKPTDPGGHNGMMRTPAQMASEVAKRLGVRRIPPLWLRPPATGARPEKPL